jgi:hypothetical protein
MGATLRNVKSLKVFALLDCGLPKILIMHLEITYRSKTTMTTSKIQANEVL